MPDQQGLTRSQAWPRTRVLIGFLLYLAPFLLVVVLIASWPIKNGNSGELKETLMAGWGLGTDPEIRLLFLVAVAGALGSSIGAAQAYAAFQGLGQFDDKWIPWYFLRFPIGVGLALVLYLIIRGGFLTGTFTQNTSVLDTINPFGIAAIAALAGMFSREASGQLDRIFANIFATRETDKAKAEQLAISLVGAKPTVAVNATGDELKIFIGAKNVAGEATTTVGGAPRDVSGISDSGFTLELTPDDVRQIGPLAAQVTNKGGKPLDFTIEVV